MLKLTSPVSGVSGIGPKYEQLLANLDIYTIEDLLWHVPFRYDDFSKITKIAELKPNETVTIEGLIEKIDNIFTRNGKKLTKAQIIDESGRVEAVWFNQHYLIKTIKRGGRYNFSGKIQSFNNKLTLTAPDYEAVEKNGLNTGRLVPIYHETAGIGSKWLRARNNDVLSLFENTQKLAEFLPEKILQEYNLMPYEPALYQIHFPDNFAQEKKARESLSFRELVVELLRVEDAKTKWHDQYEGIHLEYPKYKKEIETFIDKLPFSLTDTQDNAVEEILSDLDTQNPMNRLLEGDVGSGKTIVAVIAAYLCHLNGYKTLYMAPTEILAKQHFETFKQFLEKFDVDIKLKTASNKKTDITTDNNDIIVGTHAILHEKNDLHNVGLVIVDEQHRFGVKQREQILAMGTKSKKPNMLTMTATPIPRTLALTLYGHLEISVLNTVPNTGKKITTKVVPDKYRDKTYQAIKKMGKQTFIVCPFIEESENEMFENVKAAQKEYAELKNGVFKGIKMGLLHGKMKSTEKEAVMNDFRTGKIQVLVSTPVIEVGVDVPEAAVIVLESAERYGLASLHQLRGRVGRGSEEGFCFLFMSNFSNNSFERLRNLEDIDNGLELAEIDMKYRGQGDLYGTMQHGFKQFKVATLGDLDLLNKAKEAAKEIFPDLSEYAGLAQQVQQNGGEVAAN